MDFGKAISTGKIGKDFTFSQHSENPLSADW